MVKGLLRSRLFLPRVESGNWWHSQTWYWSRHVTLANKANNCISFGCSMNNVTLLLTCCMITSPHSCIHFFFTLHVLPSLPLAPPSCIPHPSSFPPSVPSVDSGSNETSIWPVRKTQTSLPLWEEERWTCWGRRRGKESREDCNKRIDRQSAADWVKAGVRCSPCPIRPSSVPPLTDLLSGEQY